MAQYIYTTNQLSKVVPPKQYILRDISLSFFPGAKIGVLGRNGTGKSTLLRIMAGQDKEFDGEARLADGFTCGYLSQEPQLDESKTVRQIVEEGTQEIVDVLKEYEEINMKFMDEEILNDPDKMQKLMDRQAAVQDKIDALDAWELDTKLSIAMDALRCPPDDQKISELSGGERRRVALCRLLLQQPDVLLLDEPTNDLDVDTLRALEDALLDFAGCVMVISHDRWFLDRISTHILAFEGDSQVVWFEGNYEDYEEDRKRRLGDDAMSPRRIKYKPLVRN